MRLDDPDDALHGEIGERLPMGVDLEWETDGSGATGSVHGELLVATERIELDATGVLRNAAAPGHGLAAAAAGDAVRDAGHGADSPRAGGNRAWAGAAAGTGSEVRRRRTGARVCWLEVLQSGSSAAEGDEHAVMPRPSPASRHRIATLRCPDRRRDARVRRRRAHHRRVFPDYWDPPPLALVDQTGPLVQTVVFAVALLLAGGLLLGARTAPVGAAMLVVVVAVGAEPRVVDAVLLSEADGPKAGTGYALVTAGYVLALVSAIIGALVTLRPRAWAFRGGARFLGALAAARRLRRRRRLRDEPLRSRHRPHRHLVRQPARPRSAAAVGRAPRRGGAHRRPRSRSRSAGDLAPGSRSGCSSPSVGSRHCASARSSARSTGATSGSPAPRARGRSSPPAAPR